jgi:hypothetical protein
MGYCVCSAKLCGDSCKKRKTIQQHIKGRMTSIIMFVKVCSQQVGKKKTGGRKLKNRCSKVCFCIGNVWQGTRNGVPFHQNRIICYVSRLNNIDSNKEKSVMRNCFHVGINVRLGTINLFVKY